MKIMYKKFAPTMFVLVALVLSGVISTVQAAESDNFVWLADEDEEIEAESPFRVMGDDLTNKQRIKNVVEIKYEEEWVVQIYKDEVLVSQLSMANYTDASPLNWTSYFWGYVDSESGRAWHETNCTGVTVASILSELGVTGHASLRFKSYDGYTGRESFNTSQMINGYTGYYINDDEQELDWEGKQAMLMVEQNQTGLGLGYYRGPFQLVIPGSSKGNYLGGIQSIHIDTTPDSSSAPQAASKTISNSTVAPSGDLSFTKESSIKISLSEIVEDIEDGKLEVIKMNVTEDDGSKNVYYGVNPVALMEIVGWNHTAKISLVASDGFATEFNVTHFMLRDSNYYKYADGNPTMLAFGYAPVVEEGIDAFSKVTLLSFSIFAIYVVMKKIKKH